MILKQSTAKNIQFLLISSSDNVTPVTGVTPTVTLSKNGGSFSGAAGSVTEIGNGWYNLAATTTDTNTLGGLIVHATGTGAVAADECHEVQPDVPGGNVASVTGLTVANLDVAISTRLASASYTAPDNSTIAAIAGYVDTEVAAIKAKTDNLPADTSSTLSTIAGYIDTEVAAIKAKTDNLPAAPAAVGDIPSPSSIATAVWAALTSALTTLGSIGKLLVTNVDAKISDAAAPLAGLRKNTSLTGFAFPMYDLDGDPAIDLVVAAKVVIDGADPVDMTNDPEEIGNGLYKIDIAAADVNGKSIAFRFTASGAKPTIFTAVTED